MNHISTQPPDQPERPQQPKYPVRAECSEKRRSQKASEHRGTSAQPRFLTTRWFGSHAALAVPQAAAPIAFGLLALPLTGNADDGAAMILAMMGAQLIGAVPLARLARGRSSLSYFKLLILLRSLALISILALAAAQAPFGWLVAAAALAGVVTGAAAGILRATLNSFVAVGQLPRALGVAATVNELVFVSAPVLASLLGALSPLTAVAAMAILGSAPILLLPNRLRDDDDDRPTADSATAPGATSHVRSTRVLTPHVLLWLLCAAASSTAVAAIEVSAVTLAISYGLDPSWSILFPVALCIGSVSGGIYVTARNQMPRRRTVLGYLLLSTISSGVVATAYSIEVTVAAALVLGFLLPPLATYYQLVLDKLAPTDRRAEVFAQLRNATSIGVILVSLSLTLWSIATTLLTATVLLLIATAAVVITRLLERRGP